MKFLQELSFIKTLFMVKFFARENMKLFRRFLLMALCAIPCVAGANVATTAGSNLTAWNGNSGATNNNNWNQMMNSRSLATGPVGEKPKADFGNCNSLILRCAQPKCAGCTTMELARTIVSGCVNSNATCKKHGEDLIDFISAQIVADANADLQQQQLAAQNAAAAAAAAQNSAQMQQMQQQMQQMQYEMQQQNAQQMAQMQAALDEQKQLVAEAQKQVADANASAANANASAAAAQSVTQITTEQEQAAVAGVDADLLAREKISGQILSKIENAEVALKELYATMQDAFTYAGCDTRGNNCGGPKRVKTFKAKAQKFFRPYDVIVDEAYEALEMALAVGVDVSDVIMMLSGACNQWGKFLCTADSTAKHHEGHYDTTNCVEGRSVKGKSIGLGVGGATKGGMECTPGMAVPPQDDTRCTLTQLIGGSGDNEPVLREWLDENYEGDKLVRVGCATSALDSIAIFGRRGSKQGATLDLDTLERIILQDAPDYVGGNRYVGGSTDAGVSRLKYCALTPQGYQNLLSAIQTKKLPRKICVPMKDLEPNYMYGGVIRASSFGGSGLLDSVFKQTRDFQCTNLAVLARQEDSNCSTDFDAKTGRCSLTGGCVFYGDEILAAADAEKRRQQAESSAAKPSVCSWLDCYGGQVNTDYIESVRGLCCKCGNTAYNPDLSHCSSGQLKPKNSTFKLPDSWKTSK